MGKVKRARAKPVKQAQPEEREQQPELVATHLQDELARRYGARRKHEAQLVMPV